MNKVAELREQPIEELMTYSAKELRHAASFIDRNNGKHNILNLVSVFKKLKDLGAELHINEDETGSILFHYDGKERYRDFESGAELSLALALSPLDMYSSPLYYKHRGQVYECEITTDVEKTKNNTIVIYVKELDLHKMIHMNGSEKVLCNTLDGLTLGQLVLKDNNLG